GRLVDESFKQEVIRDRTTAVVIEISDRDPGVEQAQEVTPVLVQRDVKDRDRVAALARNAAQQRDVPLDPGHEARRLRVFETELLQGANPVGIPVERVVARHVAYLETCESAAGIAPVIASLLVGLLLPKKT